MLLFLSLIDKFPGKYKDSCFTEDIMGLKEIIDSELSSLSKDTHLVNNRARIHFKPTITEVRGAGCLGVFHVYTFFFIFFPFIFISWRLTTLQYCSGFCHILT